MVAKIVRKIARELCGAFYDNMDVFSRGDTQRSERFRRENNNQHQFIAMNWPQFVPAARASMAMLLNEPGRKESEKEMIFDALLQDRGFATDAELAAPSIIQPLH